MLCYSGILLIKINIVHIPRRINVSWYNDFLVVEFFYCFTVIDWTTDMLSTTGAVYDRGGETRASRVYAMKSRLINYRLVGGAVEGVRDVGGRTNMRRFCRHVSRRRPPRTTFGSRSPTPSAFGSSPPTHGRVRFVVLSVSTITPITHWTRRVSQLRTETVRNSCA